MRNPNGPIRHSHVEDSAGISLDHGENVILLILIRDYLALWISRFKFFKVFVSAEKTGEISLTPLIVAG